MIVNSFIIKYNILKKCWREKQHSEIHYATVKCHSRTTNTGTLWTATTHTYDFTKQVYTQCTTHMHAERIRVSCSSWLPSRKMVHGVWGTVATILLLRLCVPLRMYVWVCILVANIRYVLSNNDTVEVRKENYNEQGNWIICFGVCTLYSSYTYSA